MEQYTPLNLNTKISYEISNFGNIRNSVTKKKLTAKVKATFKMKDDTRQTHYISKLVALHFIAQPSKKHIYVVHKDGDKADNHYLNLKWLTKEEFARHGQKALQASGNRNNLGGAKLKRTDIVMIRKRVSRIKTGEDKRSIEQLAAEYGVSSMQIYRIFNKQNWTAL